MDLADHLNAVYQERVLRNNPSGPLAKAFSKALKEDADLFTKAQIRLDGLEALRMLCGGELEKRCWASAQQWRTLKDGLEAA